MKFPVSSKNRFASTAVASDTVVLVLNVPTITLCNCLMPNRVYSVPGASLHSLHVREKGIEILARHSTAHTQISLVSENIYRSADT